MVSPAHTIIINKSHPLESVVGSESLRQPLPSSPLVSSLHLRYLNLAALSSQRVSERGELRSWTRLMTPSAPAKKPALHAVAAQHLQRHDQRVARQVTDTKQTRRQM